MNADGRTDGRGGNVAPRGEKGVTTTIITTTTPDKCSSQKTKNKTNLVVDQTKTREIEELVAYSEKVFE